MRITAIKKVIGCHCKKWFAPHGLVLLLVFMFILGDGQLYSYQWRGFQYISPAPGAVYVSPQSAIIFRLQNVSPHKISNLSSCVVISGNQSGKHTYSSFIASDDFTIICKPNLPFSIGEKVAVQIKLEFASLIEPAAKSFEYVFFISESANAAAQNIDLEKANTANFSISGKNDSHVTGNSKILPNGVSVPANFPDYKITISDNPSKGRLFLTTTGYDNFVMILDNNGYPFWYLNTPYPRYDFKIQRNGLLTMFVQKEEGWPFGSGFIGLDTTFTVVDSFYADLGYDTDYHELKLLETGNYLLIGTREEKINLSEYFSGGNTNVTVQESVIQEFTKKGELIFLWRAWDHFDIADLEIEDLSLPTVRFPHMNAIDIDEDGHILLSSRHLSEITKINRQTGDIIWRLGGAHNQFTFRNDPLDGFSGQHDIRALGKGRYLLFDNGNLHQPPVSRAVEYELDTDKKTATLVWQFRDTPDKYSSWMGNTQRLANGNTLINWAQRPLPKPTEVNPQGEKVFEMEFVNQFSCYRIFRFDWQGAAQKPYLIAEPYDNHLTLLFNKFGDTDINFYKIYAGETPNPTTVLDTCKTTKKSFIDFNNKQRYYFRVTAVNSFGQESPFSNEENLFVNFTAPDENMVLNADFSDSVEFWNFGISGNAQSSGAVNMEEQFHFDIQNGGQDFQNIQLYQGNLKLIKGRNYLFEFDARADENRLIEAYVTKEGDADRNYGRIGPTVLSRKVQHFIYPFTMNSPTDFKAVVVFNVGASDIDVFFDNVSLKEKAESFVADSSKKLAKDFQLVHIYPNPFNQATKMTYHLASHSQVNLNIYNINGQLICPLVDKIQQPGLYTVSWDGLDRSGLQQSSGIYFCRLDIKCNKDIFSEMKKMTLVK